MCDPLYRIAKWNSTYENNRSRDLKKTDWVPIPNRLDGDGFTELVDHPNGAAHYGAWIAMVLIASRCGPRGTLLRDGSKPHTPQSLARMTRFTAAIFEEAMPRFLEIGWLEIDPSGIPCATASYGDVVIAPQDDAPIPQEIAATPHQGVQKERRKERRELKEQKELSPRESEVVSPGWEEFWNRYPKKTGRDAACRSYFSIVDSDSEHAELMAGLQRWLDSDQWVRSLRDDGGRFIPDASKFLFDRRWQDEPTPYVESAESEDKFERAARLALEDAA